MLILLPWLLRNRKFKWFVQDGTGYFHSTPIPFMHVIRHKSSKIFHSTSTLSPLAPWDCSFLTFTSGETPSFTKAQSKDSKTPAECICKQQLTSGAESMRSSQKLLMDTYANIFSLPSLHRSRAVSDSSSTSWNGTWAPYLCTSRAVTWDKEVSRGVPGKIHLLHRWEGRNKCYSQKYPVCFHISQLYWFRYTAPLFISLFFLIQLAAH